MSNDHVKPFKQAVNSYYKSKSLSADKLQLLAELTEGVEAENSHKVNNVTPFRRKLWTMSASVIAASLMIAVVMVGFQQQPGIITGHMQTQ